MCLSVRKLYCFNQPINIFLFSIFKGSETKAV